MTLQTIIDALELKGWRVFNRSSEKDRAWLRFERAGLTIEVMVRLRVLTDSISVARLVHYCQKQHYETALKIHNLPHHEDELTSYMIKKSGRARFDKNAAPEAIACALIEPLEKEVDGFDYEVFLKGCVTSRPDIGLDFQQNHITALAIGGHYEVLMDYQDAFESGNRLNFLIPITSEMIDRALDIALVNSEL